MTKKYFINKRKSCKYMLKKRRKKKKDSKNKTKKRNKKLSPKPGIEPQALASKFQSGPCGFPFMQFMHMSRKKDAECKI